MILTRTVSTFLATASASNPSGLTSKQTLHALHTEKRINTLIDRQLDRQIGQLFDFLCGAYMKSTTSITAFVCHLHHSTSKSKGLFLHLQVSSIALLRYMGEQLTAWGDRAIFMHTSGRVPAAYADQPIKSMVTK